MLMRGSIGSIVLAAALLATVAGARALDEAKYPDWRGQWSRIPIASGPASFDPTKTVGAGQNAPLIPEYKALHEASLADMEAGGFGIDRTNSCYSPGMPRIMNVYTAMEILVLPDAVHILINNIRDNRRIYTDGRDWPDDIDPSYAGYSIGKWIDSTGRRAAMTRSRSRPAVSKARASTTIPACRCTGTTRPSSRSGSTAIRPTATSCMTTSPSSIMR